MKFINLIFEVGFAFSLSSFAFAMEKPQLPEKPTELKAYQEVVTKEVKITGATESKLTQLLSKHPDTTSLVVSHNNLTYSMVQKILRWENLTALILDDCGITVKIAEQILGSRKQISKVDLSRNNLKDLDFLKFTGATLFEDSKTSDRGLKELVFAECQLSSASLASLFNVVPKIKIVRLNG